MVEHLTYLVSDTTQYYRFCKQRSYTGVMHRINMGCEIFPRKRNFWDLEAEKTTTVISRLISEISIYDPNTARAMEEQTKKTLEDIDYQCDPYRWYLEREERAEQAAAEKLAEQEQEWRAEDYAIGIG